MRWDFNVRPGLLLLILILLGPELRAHQKPNKIELEWREDPGQAWHLMSHLWSPGHMSHRHFSLTGFSRHFLLWRWIIDPAYRRPPERKWGERKSCQKCLWANAKGLNPGLNVCETCAALTARHGTMWPRLPRNLPRRNHSILSDISFWAQQLMLDGNVLGSEWKCPWKIECFLEDLFLGSQWSIILGYRRLSVKSLTVGTILLQDFTDNTSIQEWVIMTAKGNNMWNSTI